MAPFLLVTKSSPPSEGAQKKEGLRKKGLARFEHLASGTKGGRVAIKLSPFQNFGNVFFLKPLLNFISSN